MGDDKLTETMVLMGIRLNILYLSAMLEDCVEARNWAGAAVDRNGGRAETCSVGADEG